MNRQCLLKRFKCRCKHEHYSGFFQLLVKTTRVHQGWDHAGYDKNVARERWFLLSGGAEQAVRYEDMKSV